MLRGGFEQINMIRVSFLYENNFNDNPKHFYVTIYSGSDAIHTQPVHYRY